MQRLSRQLVIAIFALVSFVLPLCASAVAAPQNTIARARAEYIRLRNVDPSGTDPVYRREWEMLAAAMRGILGSNASEGEKLRIRLVAADTQLRLYRATRQANYLRAAAEALEPALPRTSSVATDGVQLGEAYLLMGDIELSGGRASSASAWYKRSIDLGDPWASLARSRMQSLQNGTFSRFIPSRDIATPRMLTGAPTRASTSARPIVVLDPGHGGSDAGAVGPTGYQEKEITLDIARRVQLLLEKRYDYRVALTRQGDEFVPLARRTSFANKKNAVAFVSLHINASAAHDADGLEVYYLDNANDEASRKLAERENGIAHGESLDDLSFMLSDLIQTGKLEDSINLTRSVERGVRAKVFATYKDVRSLGVKKGPFFVLVGAHMPCSLVEMFFIDNPTDGKRLRQEQFRAALAAGIADGIRSFLDKR